MTVAKKEERGILLLLFTVFPQLPQPVVRYFRAVKVLLCVVLVFSCVCDLVQEAKEQTSHCQERRRVALFSIRAVKMTWLSWETAPWVLRETHGTSALQDREEGHWAAEGNMQHASGFFCTWCKREITAPPAFS